MAAFFFFQLLFEKTFPYFVFKIVFKTTSKKLKANVIVYVDLKKL